MSYLSKIVSLVVFAFGCLVFSPAAAYAADGAIGNEVKDAANATLTRTGGGTAANPYLLQLNLGNANTWTAAQTFNGVVTVGNTLNSTTLSNSGDITSGGNVAVNGGLVTTTATTAALFNTNATTLNVGGAASTLNLGSASGTTTIKNNGVVSGDLAVNGGDVTSTTATGNLFNTVVTTVNVGGSATTLSLGGSFGTTNLRHSTVNLSNATAFNALSALGSFDSLSVGGGYGSTGLSLSSSGNALLNGNLTVDGTSSLAGTLSAASASTFSPSSTSDVTFNLDSDSVFVLNGLSTETGSTLCLNASNQVVLCDAGAAFMSAPESDASLAETVQKQQQEIDSLKAELEVLKAQLQ